MSRMSGGRRRKLLVGSVFFEEPVAFNHSPHTSGFNRLEAIFAKQFEAVARDLDDGDPYLSEKDSVEKLVCLNCSKAIPLDDFEIRIEPQPKLELMLGAVTEDHPFLICARSAHLFIVKVYQRYYQAHYDHVNPDRSIKAALSVLSYFLFDKVVWTNLAALDGSQVSSAHWNVIWTNPRWISARFNFEMDVLFAATGSMVEHY